MPQAWSVSIDPPELAEAATELLPELVEEVVGELQEGDFDDDVRDEWVRVEGEVRRRLGRMRAGARNVLPSEMCGL